MALTKAQLVDLNANELIIDLDADTSITADTDDQIDIKIAGADDFRFTANTFTALSGSSIVVPASGLTIGSTAVTSTAAELNLLDGVSGLVQADLTKLAAVDATATELNFIDGGATIGTTAVADGDGIIHNDGGTMKVTTAATFKTYFQEGISQAYDDFTIGDAAVLITTSSGDITIDAAANDSDIIFKGTDGGADTTFLTIDGSAAGDATFNNQVIVGDGKLVLNSTAVTSTAAEINLIDGGTSRGTTAVATGDGILINDGGTMRMTNVDTVSTYFAGHSVGGSNIVTTGALDSGSITSGFGAIDNGTSNIRSATITAETAFVPDAANGASLGTSSLEFADLYLHDGAQILFGADQDVVLTHAADAGLTLKTATTSDDTKATLTLQTGDTDIAANDVLGQLHFQAPDEGAGTDAILVAAGIAAISEGDFSASNNATKLSFQTGASEAASEKMSLSSGGNLTISGNLIIGSATVTEAQLEILDGATVTTTELNKLDGVGTLKQAGKETIWIPALAMYPSDTGGCAALAGTELASDINRPFLQTLAFDKDSDEAAQFSIAFPKSWNEGTITFQPFFTANTTNTGSAKFMLKGVAISNDGAINVDFGTAQGTAIGFSGTAYDLMVGNESAAITIAGSPAAGDLVFFQIFRDVSADNLSSDALLAGIKIHFTTDAANDA